MYSVSTLMKISHFLCGVARLNTGIKQHEAQSSKYHGAKRMGAAAAGIKGTHISGLRV